MKQNYLATLTSIFFLLVSTNAFSQETTNNRLQCPGLDIPARPTVDEELQAGEIYVTQDRVDLTEGGMYHLQGNVELTKDAQQLGADTVDYNQTSETTDLDGNVNYWDDEVYLNADSAHVDMVTKSGSFANARYTVIGNRGRGKAKQLDIVVNKTVKGKDMDYSTCDQGGEYGTEIWKISAKELTLDQETGHGIGRNVVLKVKDIPVFYTPYLTFPLNNDRKTGFLAPVSANIRQNGVELHTPFYWNISPQMDATITPRLISDRGLMLMVEYRYLFSGGWGTINAEYLPSDSGFNDKNRSLIELEHKQSFAHNGRLHILFNNLSDKQYLKDFGSSIKITSQPYVERLADLSFAGNNWDLLARVQDFQSADRSIVSPFFELYKRLPQIQFNASTPIKNYSFNFELNSELVHFERSEITPPINIALGLGGLDPHPATAVAANLATSSLINPALFALRAPPPLSIGQYAIFNPQRSNIVSNIFQPNIDGLRFDIALSASYPIRTESYFIKPKLGARYTAYNLDDELGIFDETPNRFLPYASIDGELFFERQINLFNQNMTQTMEPRIYYLYVPNENQNDLLVFDTGIYDSSYDSMFYENQYSGADRFNDANRLTLSLTSKLINSMGQELGRLSIGQLVYFNDRKVGLPGQLARDDKDFSPLVFEIETKVNEHLQLGADLQWDPNKNTTQKLALLARYRPAQGKAVNLAYRRRQVNFGVIRSDLIDIEQTNISFRWPLSNEWNIIGRWNYALQEHRAIDIFGGIEYDSCCIVLRAIYQRFISNQKGSDIQTGFFLQFELKRLAGYRKKTVNLLTENVFGY